MGRSPLSDGRFAPVSARAIRHAEPAARLVPRERPRRGNSQAGSAFEARRVGGSDRSVRLLGVHVGRADPYKEFARAGGASDVLVDLDVVLPFVQGVGVPRPTVLVAPEVG